MKAHLAYLRYVLRHKWFVFLACRRLGVSLWQSIVHDWTKFLPVEWHPYVHQFYKPDGSKRDVTRDDGGLQTRRLDEAFNRAWLHHQKQNPHHWQYWVLINDEDGTVALEMPIKYIFEMVADWEGASRAITGNANPAGWYERNAGKMILHYETRQLVEDILRYHYDWKPDTSLKTFEITVEAMSDLKLGDPVYLDKNGKARKA